jgi:hypothetical protein
MDYLVTTRLIDSAVGAEGSQQTKDSLRQEILSLASDLAGPAPSPVEQSLATTAALAWFTLRLFEVRYPGSPASEGGLSIKLAEFQQRRIDRAHRRYLATLKTLATVRKLDLPTVQINLARQQVNLAGPR